MGEQLLQAQPLVAPESDFARVVGRYEHGGLIGRSVTTLQVNVGKLCNMACHHCHVDAGPGRTEIMSTRVAGRVLDLVAASPGIEVVDLTGGAPELNPDFRRIVSGLRELDRTVIDRCNLTVLLDPRGNDHAEFMAAHGVHIIASLPCYQPENVGKQRGSGVFEKSIEAIRRLNSLGYGRQGSELKLDLVYNPVGASLPPPQPVLEAAYKRELGSLFEIEFHNLLTITNMPIKRFAAMLDRTGEHEAYMSLLINHFNPHTLPDLMCRSLVSVGWDGRLFDCDFNQMLEIELGAAAEVDIRTLWDVASFDQLEGRSIRTGSHCFGCTAGAGSSCSGAIG